MQAQQIIGSQGERGIGSAAVIAEFNFEYFRSEKLDNRADLSADQACFRPVVH